MAGHQGLGAAPPGARAGDAVGQPAIVDSTKAKTLLGWQPRFTGLEALLATLDPGTSSN